MFYYHLSENRFGLFYHSSSIKLHSMDRSEPSIMKNDKCMTGVTSVTSVSQYDNHMSSSQSKHERFLNKWLYHGSLSRQTQYIIFWQSDYQKVPPL